MRFTLLVAMLLSPLPVWAVPAEPQAAAPGNVPGYVAKAIADPARASDTKDDARRQMTAVMLFSGVKPGDSVLELDPGAGYWTRVFSGIVGAKGHVYTVWPNETAKYSAKGFAQWTKLAATPHYGNVSLLKQPAQTPTAPTKVDVVFTSQNYHDYHDPFMGPVDIAKFDKAIYDVLKPGGVFLVIDHAAAAGTGLADTNTLHRIDPATVKQEVEAAGFVFDGESTALHNPNDPHTKNVFDQSIRGHTDQFIYRFRKPK
ncbi:MAG: methyltransferase [Rhodanobacter sp.]|nr:MAG: methyltransferase [Rhodanobacter sp.]TAM10032.1 MAG: methyltransferase [Rhodanobacter sp.]TAM34728.1 MAG: methyltransferase [Rhodanobacter sp.]